MNGVGALTFLTAEEASLDAFLSVSGSSPYQVQLRDYLGSLLRQGCTRPSWCVLASASGPPVARAAFWALPGEAVPTDVVLIAADWDEPELAAGQALLEHLHGRAADLAASGLQHHVDEPAGPPQFQENEPARTLLLLQAGYELQRDGLRWRRATPTASPPAAELSLAFRPLSDVGDDAFVEAMAATYRGTRDSLLTQHVAERGLLGAARADFEDYRELEFRPQWWELAYTAEGALAGVIMPARSPSSAVIGYVGVVPEQRGRGLAAQLVRRGTDQLVADGAAEVRGDCDRDNVAMAKAFLRAGYEQIARRRTYRRTLA